MQCFISKFCSRVICIASFNTGPFAVTQESAEDGERIAHLVFIVLIKFLKRNIRAQLFFYIFTGACDIL